MASSAEEKSLPPSEKKLRDSRRKGQLPRSQDMVSGAVLLLCSLVLVWTIPEMSGRLIALLNETARLTTLPFDDAYSRLIPLAVSLLWQVLLPLVAASLFAVVVVNIIIMKGVVFSTTALTPTLDRINPVTGAKRLFSLRSVIELLKSVCKLLLLGAAMVVVWRAHLPALLGASQGGLDGIRSVFWKLTQALMAVAVIVALLTGAMDVRLQQWLFRRDQRMTKSEKKREHKEQYGHPEIRKVLQQRRRDASQARQAVGLEQATFFIASPQSWLVGIRYVRGETAVPMVVWRHRRGGDARAQQHIAAKRLVVIEESALAELIGRQASPGEPVPENTFQSVANLLVRYRLI